MAADCSDDDDAVDDYDANLDSNNHKDDYSTDNELQHNRKEINASSTLQSVTFNVWLAEYVTVVYFLSLLRSS